MFHGFSQGFYVPILAKMLDPWILDPAFRHQLSARTLSSSIFHVQKPPVRSLGSTSDAANREKLGGWGAIPQGPSEHGCWVYHGTPHFQINLAAPGHHGTELLYPLDDWISLYPDGFACPYQQDGHPHMHRNPMYEGGMIIIYPCIMALYSSCISIDSHWLPLTPIDSHYGWLNHHFGWIIPLLFGNHPPLQLRLLGLKVASVNVAQRPPCGAADTDHPVVPVVPTDDQVEIWGSSHPIVP